MRSRRYKKHHAADCLVSHDKAGWHVMYDYTLKGPYNPLEYYKLKHIQWWYAVKRWIHVFNVDRCELRKIRCTEKYEMHNLNHDY